MEQAVIQKVTDMAIQQCAKEGLSAAQADCILAYKPLSMVGDPRKGLAAATTLNKCPAIAEKRPSWLRVPILK